MTRYAELHCHSTFSLLDGASHPERLVERAMELGLHSIAITDHDDLGGVVRFAREAAEKQFNGIIGAELTVEQPESPRDAAGCGTLTHLVLLAQNAEGYGNISSLITRSRMDHPRGRPRVSVETLAGYANGIFALTGCARGWVPRLAATGAISEAVRAAETFAEIFRRRIAIECWDHALPEERALVPALQRIARTVGVPWVVTNDVHYADSGQRLTHDVLCALKHGATLDEMGTRLRPNGEWYLKSYEQMVRRWSGQEDGLRATVEIAEQCPFRLSDSKPSLPKFPAPAGVSDHEYLVALVHGGVKERWGENPQKRMLAQIEHELSLIKKKRLAGYFLIVWDIVRFARSEGILCQGRGSAASSAVCYVLGITAVDPAEVTLLFERFLSEERDEYPDIDVDFSHRDREKILQYVYHRYGREHAAMVCEQITWRGKSAVRDAARVLGFSPEQAGLLSMISGRFSARKTAESLSRGQGDESRDTMLVQAGFDPNDPRVGHLTSIVAGLHDAPRQRSIHVGGFVLTEQPLCTAVPIEPASMDERTIIQWEKDDLEGTGLIKIDLLGLGILTVLQDCLKYIQHARGIGLDLWKMKMDDPAVYAEIQAADTVAVFQIESRAQMNALPQIRPKDFYDLVVQVAIIRPGPIQGGMVNPYIRRRNGREAVECLHPSLEPILARTLGVPLFQEQGMQVAITAAKFTAGEANKLRLAMGHKRSEERMNLLHDRMVTGMLENGYDQDIADRIFSQIKGFAGYGFPESHAASFALLVYASAYLRHYYAPEFLCATLNAQPMGFYSAGTLIEDARHHGVKVVPVDLVRSAWDHTLECEDGTVIIPDDGEIAVHRPPGTTAGNVPPVVRLGWRSVRGLGPHARKKIESALKTGGAFRSIQDFVARSQLDRRALRFVAESGALDAFVADQPPHRRRRAALWRVLEAERGSPGALALFPETPVPSALPPLSPMQITEADYRMTGLSLNGHPMKHLRALLEPNGILTAHGLKQRADGERVGIAGLVICRQQPQTAKGYVFLTLEDETGMINVVVTPKRFAEFGLLIRRNPLLLIRGTLQIELGVVNLRGEEFIALRTQAGAEYAKSHDFH